MLTLRVGVDTVSPCPVAHIHHRFFTARFTVGRFIVRAFFAFGPLGRAPFGGGGVPQCVAAFVERQAVLPLMACSPPR